MEIEASGTQIQLAEAGEVFNIELKIVTSGVIFAAPPDPAILWPAAGGGNTPTPPPAFGTNPINRTDSETCHMHVTSTAPGESFTFFLNIQELTPEGHFSPPRIIDPTIVTGPDT
jgi:hypothetical protein